MRRRLPSTAWLRRVQIDPPLSPLAAWQLGAGEAEVIEFARLHAGYGVILDDRAARRSAFGLGLKVYGTLSVLALARKRDLIPSFRQAAAAISRVGLYLQSVLVDSIAKELGE
jgi:predicted nucleic acid-binding protein